MARSPFSIFRRNQWIMIAGLGVLCMIAFVILPQIEMLMGSSQDRQNPAVVTLANLDTVIYQHELQNLVEQRHAILRFVTMATAEASRDDEMMLRLQNMQPELFGQFAHRLFGPADEENVVLTYVFAEQADRLGIEVSDAAINAFLKRLTQDKLTAVEISNIAGNLRMSDRQLFEILRRELKAMYVRELLLDQPPVVDMRSMFMSDPPIVTPGERWEYFKRGHAKATLEVLPVEIEALAKDLKDPGDETLQAYFEKYKHELPNPNTVDPGFMEPRRATFEYILVDSEKFDQLRQAEPVTEEQVLAYYEENKEFRYRQFLRDTMPNYEIPTDLALPPDIHTPIPEGHWPGMPEPETPEPDPTGTKPDQTDSDKPESPDKPGKQEPDSPDKKDDASGRDDDGQNDCLQADDDKVDAQKKPAEPADKQADKKDEQAEQQPADDNDAEKSSIEKLAEQAIAEPKVLYRPLEEVAAEIRETLQREAALESLTKTFKTIRRAMQVYGKNHTRWSLSKRENPDATPPQRLDIEQLSRWASLDMSLARLVRTMKSKAGGDAKSNDDDDNAEKQVHPHQKLIDRCEAAMAASDKAVIAGDLKQAIDELAALDDEARQALGEEGEPVSFAAHTTPHWSIFEANDSEGLGKSYLVDDLALAGRPGNEFVRQMFDQLGEFEPATSVDNDAGRYLFWKIKDTEEYVPETLDEKREEVLTAWQTNEAREIARKLGDQFAKAAKTEEAESLEQALNSAAGEPVTAQLGISGEKLNEETKTVGPFSWLSQVARGQTGISEVEGLKDVDQHFMKRVFNLTPGDFGYSLNYPQDTLYIYRVKVMEPAPRHKFYDSGWRDVNQIASSERGAFIRTQILRLFEEVGLEDSWRLRILGN